MKKTLIYLLSPMILSMLLTGCYHGAKLTDEERIQLEQKQKIVSNQAITTNTAIPVSQGGITPGSITTPDNLTISKGLLWDWQKHFYSDTDLTNSKTKQDILSALKDGYLNEIFVEYPSEEQGFSSNDKDVNTEYYVSMTKEDAIVKLGSQIERIVNPVYGEWFYFQYPQNIPLEDKYKRIYDGLASDEYLKYLINNQDIEGVIYIDKDNEDYRTFPTSNNINVRFTGIIKNVEILSANSKEVQLALKIDYVNAKNKLKVFESRKMIITFERDKDTFLIKTGYFEY